MPVFFLGALIGLIGNLFISAARIIVDVIRAIMPVVRKVFEVVKSVVVQIGRQAGRFFRFIANAARSLYNNVLVPIADAARKFYERFTTFLRRVLDPVIRIFDKVRDVLNTIWTNILAPILDAIEKIRQVLTILAKLGVPFAEALEQILARIEREIFTRFQQIQRWVNTATFWLDLLLDPKGFIRSTPFLYTIYLFGGNVMNIITKLADLTGLNQVRVDTFRAENPVTPATDVTVRVRSGEIRESFAVQGAAARFRSGRSGTLL